MKQFNLSPAKLCLIIVLLTVTSTAESQTIFITPGGSGNQSGSSWSNAAPGNQLQNKINDAPAGAQIWMSAGTYKPNAFPPDCIYCGSDPRDYSFKLKNGVALYGGFNGTENSLNARAPGINSTILSGDIGIEGDENDNAYHVVLSISNDNTTILDGFTIRDGNANGTRNTSSVTVPGSIEGGGIAMGLSSAILSNCTFENNRAERGAAVQLKGSSSSVSSCRVLNNSVGNAMDVREGSTVEIKNCIFYQNSNNAGYGGAIASMSSTTAITNCSFVKNRSLNGNGEGSAISVSGGSVTVANSVFSGNVGLSLIYDLTGSANVSYSMSESGYPGNGNLAGNPMFINITDPDGADNIFGTADDGLRLSFTSQAYNAGSNAVVSGITTDIAGNARIQNGIVDMGAYEGIVCPPSNILYVNQNVASTGNGSSWASAIKSLSEALAIAQRCSNFNTIMVAKGTYLPTDNGDRDSSFVVLRGGLKIYGGYDAATGTRNIKTNPTILSGDIGTTGNSSDNSFHVMVIAGLTSTSDSMVLDGFTISNGNSNGGSSLKNYNGNPVQRSEGAGVYLRSNNGAGGKLAIRNCWFTANVSATYGGGFLNHLSSPAVVNCIFSGNAASNPGGGGAMFNFNESSPSVINCIFTGNSSASVGGAILNYNNASAVITNCTFYGNTAAAGGGAIGNSSANPVITNCIMWGNGTNINTPSANISYSIVEGGYSGTGNKNEDPIFSAPYDTDGADNILGTADDGIRPLAGSPALQAGINTAVPSSISTDITGSARTSQGIVDMGAYEGGLCIVNSNTLYVDKNVSSPGNGSSWSSAFREFRDALNFAAQCTDVKIIYVAKGTYLPTSNNSRDSSFTIYRGGLKIYGGFPSGGGARNIVANQTILSGDIGVTNNNSDNSFHVLVISGLGSNADSLVLDGFTVTKGYGNALGEKYYNGNLLLQRQGAGININTSNGAGGKIALRNLNITGNTASYGGGLFLIDCSPTITDCSIIGNATIQTDQPNNQSGGGMYLYRSSPVIINSAFASNLSRRGAGMHGSASSAPELINCVFTDNHGTEFGAAIAIESSTMTIRNTTVIGNTSSTAFISGNGGLYSLNSVVNITNSILRDNSYPDIYNDAGFDVTCQNSSVGGFIGILIQNNINADPQFVNAADADGADDIFGTADDGFKLKATSPLINAGNNAMIPAGITTDFAGASRIQQGKVDLGAYESPYEAYSISSSVTGGLSVCAGMNLSFNLTTTGEFQSGNTFKVQLSNASGSFSNPITLTPQGSGNPLSIQIPENTSAGTGYRIRVISSDPAITGTDNGQDITINVKPELPVITANGPLAFCTGGSVILSAPDGYASYLWSNGATAKSIIVNQPGIYTIIVKGSGGCSSPSSDAVTVTVNSSPGKPTITPNGPASFCTGGSVILSAPDGYASYLWSNGATTKSITVNQSGAFTVQVTNANGCSSASSDEVTVTVNGSPERPAITANGPTSFCTGGSVILSAPDGYASYLWNNGATTKSIMVNQSGSYSIVVTNGSGCSSSSSDAVTVTVNSSPEKPAITPNGPASFCTGGSVILSAPDGYASYLWSNGATTKSITVNQSGAFTVQVTNANGCSSASSDEVTVTVNGSPERPAITANGPTSFCTGGSVILSAPDGYASYLWNNGATTKSITVNQSGSYSIVVTNGSGCSSSSSDAVTVTVNSSPGKPTITPNGPTSFCTGGSVTLSAPDGYASYLWNNGATTKFITVNQTGSFTVTVSSGAGCTSVPSNELNVTVNNSPEKPTITPNGPTSFCTGGNVTLSAPDGYASYLWNNGATTKSITINQTGSFMVTVSSGAGCTSVPSNELNVTSNNRPGKPAITPNGPTSFCTGGSVVLSAPDGYTSYLWSNGASTKSITVNQAGLYTVVISNAKGCTSPTSEAVSVTVSNALEKPVVTANGATSFCTGGSVTLAAPNGFASYKWSNGATTKSISVNKSGSYTVIVNNATGCTSPASDAVIVTVTSTPSKPVISKSGSTSICSGGSVTLTAPDGFTSYKWSNGATTQSITVTKSGSYCVIVSSGTGCTSPASNAVVVSVSPAPAKPAITKSGSTSFCTGGSVTLTAPNGCNSYLWSNGARTRSITVKQSGSYTLTVTNSNGCESPVSDAVVVTVSSAPEKPVITPNGATSFCNGGSVTLAAPDGFAVYKWSNGATTKSITVNKSGSYTVSVGNGTSCMSPSSNAIVISVGSAPGKPTISKSGSTSFCTGGSVTLTAPNGFNSYLWSNGATTKSITVTESGSYRVTVSNGTGCASPVSDAVSVTVTDAPAKPVITAGGPTTFAQGGNVVLTAPAGFASYLWSNGATTQSVTVSTAGTYTVTVKNSSGCSSVASAPVTVTIQAPPVTSALSISHQDGNFWSLININIRPNMVINNEGSAAVPYKELTIRYWLTVEDYAPMSNLAVDWAELGTSKVKMKYVKLGQPRDGAYGYVEYSFESSAGNLKAKNNSGVIQSRIAKSDWTLFNEEDDHSYAKVLLYAKNNKITLYRNGSLVWGTEPLAVTPMQKFRVMNENKSSNKTNTISNIIRLNNEGNKPVSYKDITVRYWFTADGNKPLNHYLDYAELGSNNIRAKFVKLSSALSSADYYLELSFTAADSLYPLSSTGRMDSRMSKSDWSNFTQANDHSYKSGSSSSENRKITVYLKGILVYGEEPAGLNGNTRSIGTEITPAKLFSRPNVNQEPMQVKVIGNPVRGSEMAYEIRGAYGEKLRIAVLDASGSLVREQTLDKAALTERGRMNISNIPNGIVYLRVSSDKEVKTVKVIKAN